MKRLPLAPAALCAAIASGSSALALTQPNNVVIPVGASLQELFTDRGESIDAVNDAAILPETFVPACALTFVVLQRNAGYRNSFGWYNVTGTAPSIGDLHEFLSCDDDVGTSRVLDIRNDPAYAGGEIGFYEATGACATPQNSSAIFFSQRAYNPDGDQQNPFIHLLIYNSTVTPRAFYFGWEDLLSGGDNDFDDLTTFVTGITCSGGGGACDTGRPGICADGTMQCQSGQLTCVQSNAQADEVCNGLDDDCDGTVDEGDLCDADEVCDQGTCVPTCNGGEFVCPPDKECNASGYCVDPSCVDLTCPEGQKCIEGVCRGPCEGVVCPYGQVCRVGACVDPCASITCDAEQICVAGACVNLCQCGGCGADETCQSDGRCIKTACLTENCGPGEYCADDGTCVDACDAASCPAGQHCTLGQCVLDGSGGGGGHSNGEGGNLFGSGGGGNAATGGAGGAGGAGSNQGGHGARLVEAKEGCGCRTGDGAADRAPHWLLTLGATALAAALRRRRRHP